MAKNNKTTKFNPAKHLLNDSSSFTVQEAYKTFRTNVAFSIPGSEAKCIGITSSSRGDGKSLVAINLAISFAQIGKKVIVIDADMRIPTIASKLQIKKGKGLTDFLVGEESINQCIFKIAKYNIAVLPSGNKPPDPTSLLESTQMSNLIDELKAHFDYIIFDLPPISLVPDALIISKYLHGYLFIVRNNATRYKGVSSAIKQLEFADAKLLGFVFNKKVFNEKKYYRSSYYNYYYKN